VAVQAGLPGSSSMTRICRSISFACCSTAPSHLELEAGGRNVGYDPLGIPFGVHAAPDSGRPKPERPILLVPLRQVRLQLAEQVRIARQGIEVAHRQIRSPVERESDSVAAGAGRQGRRVMAAGRTFLAFRRA
jgi:hypothetical protein